MSSIFCNAHNSSRLSLFDTFVIILGTSPNVLKTSPPEIRCFHAALVFL